MTIIVKSVHPTFVWNFALLPLLQELYETSSETKKNALMSIYLFPV